MPTTLSPMPKELEEKIVKHYRISLLGDPFSELHNENGRIVIKYGYIYEGVKYYVGGM